MSHITSPSCVPDASGLGRELTLKAMARALEKVVQITDPNQRRVELHRAGFIKPPFRDELDAMAILNAKRRALAASCGSLVA